MTDYKTLSIRPRTRKMIDDVVSINGMTITNLIERLVEKELKYLKKIEESKEDY